MGYRLMCYLNTKRLMYVSTGCRVELSRSIAKKKPAYPTYTRPVVFRNFLWTNFPAVTELKNLLLEDQQTRQYSNSRNIQLYSVECKVPKVNFPLCLTPIQIGTLAGLKDLSNN